MVAARLLLPYTACRNGDLDFRNTQEADGHAIIHHAICAKNSQAVEWLLAKGADAERPTARSKATPLLLAARTAQPGIVFALLKHGVDINRADVDGMTALHYAAQEGDVHITRMLLLAGALSTVRNVAGLPPAGVAKGCALEIIRMYKPSIPPCKLTLQYLEAYHKDIQMASAESKDSRKMPSK
jgi:ankyrin repeat protein